MIRRGISMLRASFTVGNADSGNQGDLVAPLGDLQGIQYTRLTVNASDGTNNPAELGLFQAADGQNARAALAVANYEVMFNGTSWDRRRTPSTWNSVTASAAGNTVVYPALSGQTLRLMGYSIDITGNATLAVAGILTMTFYYGSAGFTGQQFSCYLPAAVPVPTLGVVFQKDIALGNGLPAPASNQALNINLSAALVTGVVRVAVQAMTGG